MPSPNTHKRNTPRQSPVSAGQHAFRGSAKEVYRRVCSFFISQKWNNLHTPSSLVRRPFHRARHPDVPFVGVSNDLRAPARTRSHAHTRARTRTSRLPENTHNWNIWPLRACFPRSEAQGRVPFWSDENGTRSGTPGRQTPICPGQKPFSRMFHLWVFRSRALGGGPEVASPRWPTRHRGSAAGCCAGSVTCVK